MAQSGDGTDFSGIELSATGNSLFLPSQNQSLSIPDNSSSSSAKDSDLDEDSAAQWAAIQRLPAFERLRLSLLDENNGNEGNVAEGKRIVDVTRLSVPEKHVLMEKPIGDNQHDNLRLLKKLRERLDNVGIKLPTIEVRYQNVHVELECEVVDGKPLPSIWNSFKSMILGLVRLPYLTSLLREYK